ncbi:MAG TPA: SHOCT domain-containing protein [Solirubrobacterales bacterium]|nr:SHOCT domain-containing protein [Solirubrobacterales bacterium]
MATLYGFATELATGVLPLASWDNDDGPGWLFGLVFWIALIAMVFLLVRGRGWFGPGGPRAQARESGSQILERRFAEGELSADEYRERRAVLDEGGRG